MNENKDIKILEEDAKDAKDAKDERHKRQNTAFELTPWKRLLDIAYLRSGS